MRYSKSSTITTHLEYAIGCRVDDTPRCMTIAPPSREYDTKIAIAGATAKLSYKDYDGEVHVERVTL